jgi:hypothetical protein
MGSRWLYLGSACMKGGWGGHVPRTRAAFGDKCWYSSGMFSIYPPSTVFSPHQFLRPSAFRILDSCVNHGERAPSPIEAGEWPSPPGAAAREWVLSCPILTLCCGFDTPPSISACGLMGWMFLVIIAEFLRSCKSPAFTSTRLGTKNRSDVFLRVCDLRPNGRYRDCEHRRGGVLAFGAGKLRPSVAKCLLEVSPTATISTSHH